MPQQLDYRTPAPGRGGDNVRLPAAPAIIATVVVLALNFFLSVSAASDPGFGAMCSLMFVGPIANGILFFVFLAFEPMAKRNSNGPWHKVYLVFLFVLPPSAIIFDIALLQKIG
jgi:hypothetical protein